MFLFCAIQVKNVMCPINATPTLYMLCSLVSTRPLDMCVLGNSIVGGDPNPPIINKLNNGLHHLL